MKNSPYASAITKSSDRANVSKVKLNKNKISTKLNKKVTLKATLKTKKGIKPTSKKVRWYSTDKNVVTVSKKGKVKAKSKGTCLVYAVSHNGKKSAKVNVTVK